MFHAIIGIAKNNKEVMELLFNFHKHQIYENKDNNYMAEFMHNTFNVRIYEIKEIDYNYLDENINQHLDEIQKKHGKFKYDDVFTNYLLVSLDEDGPVYEFFDKKFHKKYHSIIKKSKLVIKN